MFEEIVNIFDIIVRVLICTQFFVLLITAMLLSYFFEIVWKYTLLLLHLQTVHIQFPKMNMVPLVNKPYVNGVNFREQNLSLKSCQSFEVEVWF